MKHSRRPQDRLLLDALTAGVDLLTPLRRHRFRQLDISVPDDHQLLWFDVFPLAGALVLIHKDTPLWICRWRRFVGYPVVTRLNGIRPVAGTFGSAACGRPAPVACR